MFDLQYFSLLIAILFLRLCALKSNCHGCEKARFKALCHTKRQLYKIAQVFAFTFKCCSLRKSQEVQNAAKDTRRERRAKVTGFDYTDSEAVIYYLFFGLRVYCRV